MKILDLFCGAGGSAEGLKRAFPDSHIMGVDLKFQPNYPFFFVQSDALKFVVENQQLIRETFDFVWASPPCQAYSFASAHLRKQGVEYPDLLMPTRVELRQLGLPYAIENVVGAKLVQPVRLCGPMFDLKVYRHRLFETSFPVEQPDHIRHAEKISVKGEFVTVAGHGGRGSGRLDKWQKAMDINWMTKEEMAQAVPPAYAEYIGQQYLIYLEKMEIPDGHPLRIRGEDRQERKIAA